LFSVRCRRGFCLLFPFILRIVSQTFLTEEREFKEETYLFHDALLLSLIVRRALARTMRYIFKFSGVG